MVLRNIIIMFDSIDEEYIFTTLKYKNSPVAHVKPTVKMLAMLEQFKADL